MSELFEQHHLTAERNGDLIIIRQIDHSGNEAAIALHLSQLRILAGLLGLVPPVPRPAAPKAITGGPEGMDSLEVSTDDDGTIWLSQTRVQGMGGTDAAVALHPIQAAWLAEQLGASASALVSPNGQQARALRRLWAKLDLLTSDCWMSEIVERCGDGLVYQTYALDAHNILADLLEDLGLEVPQGDEPTEAARQAGALTAAALPAVPLDLAHQARDAGAITAERYAALTAKNHAGELAAQGTD